MAPIKEFCVRGHRRTAENINNKRECLTCKKERSKREASEKYKADPSAFMQQDWVKKVDKTSESFRRKKRINALRYNYGITQKDVDTMYSLQNGKCGICEVPFESLEKAPCVDHAHDITGKFRGLLCNSCNFGLGLFRDNPSVLSSAIAYLERAAL